MVRTPQFRAASSKPPGLRNSPPTRSSRPSLVETPQAGGVVRNTRPHEPASTSGPALNTAAQETEAEEMLVRTPQAGGSISNQVQEIAKPSILAQQKTEPEVSVVETCHVTPFP